MRSAGCRKKCHGMRMQMLDECQMQQLSIRRRAGTMKLWAMRRGGILVHRKPRPLCCRLPDHQYRPNCLSRVCRITSLARAAQRPTQARNYSRIAVASLREPILLAWRAWRDIVQHGDCGNLREHPVFLYSRPSCGPGNWSRYFPELNDLVSCVPMAEGRHIGEELADPSWVVLVAR